ncbi:hypothetical protein BH11VER1_BH11VER1_15200 [soil metagenome]
MWFCIVFGGADWVTAHRIARVRVHFDFELRVPLVPSFTLAYMSIYALFLSAPLILREKREISMLLWQQAVTITIAGIGFLLVPGVLAYPPPHDLGSWDKLFRFADWLNLEYNLVPSLHVALSVVCLENFATRATPATKCLLRGWGVLIALSTLLTHQHHLVDAVTGYVLALAVVRIGVSGRHKKFAST